MESGAVSDNTCPLLELPWPSPSPHFTCGRLLASSGAHDCGKRPLIYGYCSALVHRLPLVPENFHRVRGHSQEEGNVFPLRGLYRCFQFGPVWGARPRKCTSVLFLPGCRRPKTSDSRARVGTTARMTPLQQTCANGVSGPVLASLADS